MLTLGHRQWGHASLAPCDSPTLKRVEVTPPSHVGVPMNSKWRVPRSATECLSKEQGKGLIPAWVLVYLTRVFSWDDDTKVSFAFCVLHHLTMRMPNVEARLRPTMIRQRGLGVHSGAHTRGFGLVARIFA